MKWMIVGVLFMTLAFVPGLSGQEEEGEISPGLGSPDARPPLEGAGGGPPPPGRFFRGRGPQGREGFSGMQFKQFRQEVRALGEEIRENDLLIQSLEEELDAVEPGIPRAEVRKKLAETQRRQAELQMELARKKVNFTRRARDIAQQRYDEARLDLERVRQKIEKDYPDLAGRSEPAMSPPPDVERSTLDVGR
ncbi:MAG: hypothetical protein V1789_10540 [PVC group bacterium]